jgi:hypothetical protein
VSTINPTSSNYFEKIIIWISTNVLISIFTLLVSVIAKERFLTADLYVQKVFLSNEIFLICVGIAADGLGSSILARNGALSGYIKSLLTTSIATTFILLLISLVFFAFFQASSFQIIHVCIFIFMIMVCSLPGKVT